MWQVHHETSDEQLEEFREIGINTIHSFNMRVWSDSQVKKYLDRAADHGIGVIAWPGTAKRSPGSPLGWTYEEENARKFINKWKSHPAILAWHILDEPLTRQHPKSFQKAVYRFVKNLDPVRPVMISLDAGGNYQWEEYFTEKAFDVLEIHEYPNPNVDRTQRVINDFLKYRTKNYPVIAGMRAFNAPKWVDIPPGTIKAQYALYKKYNLADNIAFYGWNLSPDIGLKQSPQMYNEVKAILREISNAQISSFEDLPK